MQLCNLVGREPDAAIADAGLRMANRSRRRRSCGISLLALWAICVVGVAGAPFSTGKSPSCR
jgi:hypothetical protein